LTAVNNPTWASLLANPIHALAFGFGSGLSPKAPGTVGTLAAIPFYLLISSLPLALYIAVLIVTFAVGVYLCDKTSKDLGVHDHPGIVWDEFVGYWITMLAAPAGWLWIVVGFLWFRLFDVLKPWPINWLDAKVEGGFGIMIDDVLAGFMALACLHISYWVVM
jgi:phosphatidylglycerophosphatase A